jgi:LmbE family N-acetylglucosaminyl deacetylase
MSLRVVHLLAHYDDEYAALPLIRAFRQAGHSQRFLFLTRPARGAARRRAESRAMLAHLGLDPATVEPLGEAADWADGQLPQALPHAFAALDRLLDGGREADMLVTSAWEGGHQDHDACAALAVALARKAGGERPILQVGLYNGDRLPGPFFRAAAPLPESGPVSYVAMSAREWAAYAAAVRFYPSQAPVWSTLWPAMFASFARRGFAYQHLEPARVRERPHPGPLLYERRGRAAYADVRAGVDALLDGLGLGASPQRLDQQQQGGQGQGRQVVEEAEAHEGGGEPGAIQARQQLQQDAFEEPRARRDA